jgi:6-pyruvoyltetrahydropterin/6-carboxytetrahydropterin synthase
MTNLQKAKICRGEHMFSSTHFLPDMGKCERLHGHNYQVEVELGGIPAKNGAIIDFNDLVPIVTRVVRPLDHYIIIASKDTRLTIIESESEVEIQFKDNRYIFPKNNCVMLPIKQTTVESLSKYLANRIGEVLIKSYPNIHWIDVLVSEGQVQSASTKVLLKE